MRANRIGVMATMALLGACGTVAPPAFAPASPDYPQAMTPATATPTSDKAHADVVAELLPGADCSGNGPARFAPGDITRISLCLSTSLEAFCGSTVKLSPAHANESGHFELRAIAHNPKLDDPNSKVPFPWAIVVPVPTLDLGSTGGNDGLASGKRVRFATYDLAPTEKASLDRYRITLSGDTSIGLRKGGTCGNAYEASVAASIELVRKQ